ncbi:MAG: Potassium channel [Bogoriella megaspora]|nr:MAG: Potassium channel [Bogoriella megaspora]
MNDPGLDKPVGQAAENVDNDPYRNESEYEEEENQNFLNPSRWWFASTACPLIAGTFGPMASAFSICALVENWRVYIPPGSSEGYGQNITDPAWLIAINTISLICALAANFALLLNMAQRARFEIAQPVTIVGFAVSGFLLIALVSAASTRNFRIEPRSQHALSQAYYYGIIAAVIYGGVTISMCITVYGAYTGKYKKEFKLTGPQRTLMLQTISFMAYMLFGALVYSKIEGWQFLDAVFFVDFTLLTVGIGDNFTPLTHAGRSLLFPFAIGGIVMVGLVVGSIRSLVLERGKEKIQARITEKKRERALRSVNYDNHTIQISWFQTLKFSEQGKTESERREQEFRVMRAIQDAAQTRRRYMALAASTIAAFVLWLIGAVVFWQAERLQGWSYFVALYFSYTCLLTVGYGDFIPMSNSGKAFFVFWSLLAVPTLTILISNMGDTVVKGFSQATDWVGAVTLLPAEKGMKEKWKSVVARAQELDFFKSKDISKEQAARSSTIRPPQSSQQLESGTTKKSTAEKVSERLSNHLEEKELEEAQQAASHGDVLERDIHFYHYVLAKEIRHMMVDVHASPPVEYSYSEWAYYLKLIGQDEDDSNFHRSPPIEVQRVEEPDPNQAAKANGAKTIKKWSWLGNRSPLMGDKSEAQWILERLSMTLESELLRMRSPSRKERMRKPPISMADLVKATPKLSNSDDSQTREKHD